MSEKPLTEKFNRPMKYTDKVFLVDSPKRTRGFYDDLFREAIHDAEKQARAEVLASVLATFDERLERYEHEAALKRHGTIVAVIKHRIIQVQPAAADLKALLREEHIKGHGCSSKLEAKKGRMMKVYSCGAHELTGLAKARASEVKG